MNPAKVLNGGGWSLLINDLEVGVSFLKCMLPFGAAITHDQWVGYYSFCQLTSLVLTHSRVQLH